MLNAFSKSSTAHGNCYFALTRNCFQINVEGVLNAFSKSSTAHGNCYFALTRNCFQINVEGVVILRGCD